MNLSQSRRESLLEVLQAIQVVRGSTELVARGAGGHAI